jgi:hypothetical protein
MNPPKRLMKFGGGKILLSEIPDKMDRPGIAARY